MHLTITGPLWFWRGPAPWHFVTVPEPESAELATIADAVSYGWGMIPARVTIETSTWSTALWPKDGGYIVPIKTAIRTAQHLDIDDSVTLCLDISL
jgi:hypothetical protein